MRTRVMVKNILVIMFIPILLYVVFLILRPEAFGVPATVYNIFQQSIISCIIAWGLSFTMMMDQYDLAVGSEIVLVAILGALLAPYWGIPGIIIGGIIGSILTGIVKSLTFKYLKIPTMILTIALTYGFSALGGIITDSGSLIIDPSYSILAQTPWNILIFAIAGAAMFMLHRFSPYGAQARAVGSSESLSKVNGINVEKVRIAALMISSIFGGIAAILKLSHGSSVAPTNGLASISLILEPIMCVFIGMVMSRFVNIVGGIFVGSLLMSIISNGLIAVSMPASFNNVVIGGVLLVLMSFIQIKTVYDENKIKKNIAQMRLENNSTK